MNPSRLFILRPVATSLLMLALLLADSSPTGTYRFRRCLKSLSIQAEPYPGASQDIMASLITAPLERQLGQLPGLKQMSSTSSGGASVIVLQFDLNLQLDIAQATTSCNQCRQ